MSLEKKRRDVDESNPQVDITSRENSAAYQLKAVVIEGVINTYKKYKLKKDGQRPASMYMRIITSLMMVLAITQHGTQTPKMMLKLKYAAGALFHQGMSGGISDIGGNLRFIPKAGRKKKQTKEKGTDLDPEDMEESVEEIEAPTQQFSEYGTSDCV
ncbi:hypothetical protein PSENEW3_00004202 [Picochlorum sp. SENEW3]|nr:hypothetical protein PSENEW3_00004202 [Picochlorum sp. SENEW3]